MRRQRTLVGIPFAASITIATAFIAIPQLLRIALGILIVFFLPGFSIMHALFPSKEFTRIELLLASLGISLAATVCMAVLVAALPIGLTRGSLAIALGGGTTLVAMYAWFRMRLGALRQRNLNIRPARAHLQKERN